MIDRKMLNKIGISSERVRLDIEKGNIVVENDKLIISDEKLLILFVEEALKQDEVVAKKLISEIKDKDLKALYLLLLAVLNDDKFAVFKYTNKLENSSYRAIGVIFNYIYNNGNYLLKIDDYISLFMGIDVYYPEIMRIFKVFDKYMKLGQFRLASSVLDEVMKIHSNAIIITLSKSLNKMKDNTNYILDEYRMLDEETVDYFHLLERQLLLALEHNDIIKFQKLVDVLKASYIGQNTICFDIMRVLLIKCDYLKNNPNLTSKRDFRRVIGDFDSVVAELLKANDYYRIDKVMKDGTKNKFGIKLEIYKLLVEELMVLNKHNEDTIKQELTGYSSMDDVFYTLKKTNLANIDFKTIKEQEETMQLAQNDNVNFYALYLDDYRNGRYVQALKNIMLFDRKMKSMGIDKNINCIISDLKLLIMMSQKYENFISKYQNILNQIDIFRQENNSLGIRNEVVKLEEITEGEYPRCYAFLAQADLIDGSFECAFINFQRADDGTLTPDDYIDMVECAIRLEKWEDVLKYVRRYERYYPEENVKLYYYSSIAYLHLGNYDDALKALEACEVINCYIHDVEVDYTCEKQIIANMRSKVINREELNEKDYYSYQDYVDYFLRPDENEVVDYVEAISSIASDDDSEIFQIIENLLTDNINLEERIEFLFGVIKFYMINKEIDKAKRIASYMKEYLSKLDSLGPKLTLALKNYKIL